MSYIPFLASQSQEKRIKQIGAWLQHNHRGTSFSRLWIVPDTRLCKEQFFHLSIGPTDEFIDTLRQKLEKTTAYQPSEVYYKILSERHEQRIDYFVLTLKISAELGHLCRSKLRAFCSTIRWVPPTYALLQSAIEYLSRDTHEQLIAYVHEEGTYAAFFRDKTLLWVKPLLFCKKELLNALRQDHYSSNQAKAELELGFDFSRYISLERSLSTKMLIDTFVVDIKRTCQQHFSQFEENPEFVGIITDTFQTNRLDILLLETLKIPSAYLQLEAPAGLLPEQIGIKDIPEEAQFIGLCAPSLATRMDLFLPMTLQHLPFRFKLPSHFKRLFHIKSELNQILASIALVAIFTLILNSWLSIQLTQSNKMLFKVKNQITRMKQQYLDTVDISDSTAELRDFYQVLTASKSLQKKASKIILTLLNVKADSIYWTLVRFDQSTNKITASGHAPELSRVNALIDSIQKSNTDISLKLTQVSEGHDSYEFTVEAEIK